MAAGRNCNIIIAFQANNHCCSAISSDIMTQNTKGDYNAAPGSFKILVK